MPLHTEFDSIEALRSALNTGKISALELADSALSAVDARSDLNAFLHVDPELTRAQARTADAMLAKGQAGSLTGVPIAHKDVFVTQGWRTTAASKMLAHYTSPFDATVVSLLE